MKSVHVWTTTAVPLLFCTTAILYMACSVQGKTVSTLADKRELDLTSTPTLKPEQYGRSVNLSFFVPAFSLFALASQFMPQIFPTLTPTTTSRRSKRDTVDWVEDVIRKGVVY